MSTATQDTARTARLLKLMKKGDDAFNARDLEAVDAAHHPDMVAHITGLPQPIYGREAHSAAMRNLLPLRPTSLRSRIYSRAETLLRGRRSAAGATLLAAMCSSGPPRAASARETRPVH
jgi:SnoaL-like domain